MKNKLIILLIVLGVVSCKKEEVEPIEVNPVIITNTINPTNPIIQIDTITGNWEFLQYNYLNGERDSLAGIEYSYDITFISTERTILMTFYDEWGQITSTVSDVSEIRNLNSFSYELNNGSEWILTNYKFIDGKLYLEESTFSELPLTKTN